MQSICANPRIVSRVWTCALPCWAAGNFKAKYDSPERDIYIYTVYLYTVYMKKNMFAVAIASVRLGVAPI